MAKLSDEMKVSSVIQKKINQLKTKMKEKVKQSKNFLDCVAPSKQKQKYTIYISFSPLFKTYHQ